MIQTIYAAILSIGPALTAVIGCFVSFIRQKRIQKITSDRLLKAFDETRQEVANTKEYEQLKAELAEAHRENRELKALFKEYLTKIDRVSREE